MTVVGQNGFTQIELVVTLVIAGIVASVALPRFSGESGAEGRGFSDEVASALRYAQKSAVASRRLVCASLTSSTLQLTIASAAGATACDTNLTGPGGLSPHKVDAGDAKFHNAVAFTNGFPGALYFDALGRPVNSSGTALSTATTLGINGGVSITIEAETGHVHF